MPSCRSRTDSPGLLLLLFLGAALSGCAEESPDDAAEPIVWDCVLEEGADPDFSNQIGCLADFDALASLPLDTSIPGARSVKTVIDRTEDDALYFQNSERYPIHWEFATAHLSAPDHQPVPALASFNTTEYYSPSRRFILGAVTFYEGPGAWAFELSPYDSADADMIATAYRAIRGNAYFGSELSFHPTSQAIAAVAEDLPDDVQIITTEQLFAGIDYQPLNLATAMGQLRFVDEDATDQVGFRDIVVLEAVPNDITVVSGIITQTFQTPLSHINVLSQNRGTPNMGLRGAWEDEDLRALEGAWVELVVTAFDWSIREVTTDEADAWWDSHRPDPIEVGPMDTSITELRDIYDVTQVHMDQGLDLGDAISAAVPAFGGKVTHFSGLAHIPEVPIPAAFGIPVYYFDQFMQQNNLWEVVEAMLVNPDFINDPIVKAEMLAELRASIEAGVVDPDFDEALHAKLEAEFPGIRMRFRSSTNAEDIGGFNGAGLYTSRSGDPGDPDKPVMEAVQQVWASVYTDRAFSEREYYGIEHRNIGMAMLVHRSFPDEDANGVAITANIFDSSGLEPGFYVNVQLGEGSVVLPDAGVTTDQFLHYYTQPGQPIVYLANSNLVDEGSHVLTTSQVYELGGALQAIHEYFAPVYGTDSDEFYGMDVEFKFDSSAGNGSELFVKQARPYPGWGG